MKEFATAARLAAQDENGEPAEVIEFSIAGQEFRALPPSPGRISLLLSARGGAQTTRESWDFLRRQLLDDGYDRLRKLVADDIVPLDLLFLGDDLNDEGIIDFIIGADAGRPTQPSSGSSDTPSDTGSKSTGRTPARVSTRSDSPSTDS
jgi:hypothetical protein